jgi:hypothetical protein
MALEGVRRLGFTSRRLALRRVTTNAEPLGRTCVFHFCSFGGAMLEWLWPRQVGSSFVTSFV